MPLQIGVIAPIGPVPLVLLRLDDIGLLRLVLRAVQARGDGDDIDRRQQGKLARELLQQLEAGAEQVM